MYKIKNNDVLAKSKNIQVIKTNIISYQKEKDWTTADYYDSIHVFLTCYKSFLINNPCQKNSDPADLKTQILTDDLYLLTTFLYWLHVDSRYKWSVKISTFITTIYLNGLLTRK